MKRNRIRGLLCLLAAAALLAALCACGAGAEPGASEARTEAATQTEPPAEAGPRMTVLDRAGKRLGEIDGRAAATAADAGIVYSVFAPAEYRLTGTAEYRFFRAADQKDLLLGRLEDQAYEAVYARTELNGLIYTLAVTGNPADETPDPLWLLALDPAGEDLRRYKLSEDGFPYVAMAAVGGKLLIVNHETLTAHCDRLLEFDPASGALRELLAFPAEAGASLRGVCAAADGFCLLRLRVSDGKAAELLLDRYDGAGKKLSERSLNELLLPAAAALPGLNGEEEQLQELGGMVSGFRLEAERYLYYENFGLLRAVLDLERGETLLARDDLWALSRGSGSPALFRLDFDGAAAQPEILTLQDGAPTAFPFEPADAHRMLRALSRAPGGSWLLQLSDSDKAYAGSEVLYYWQEP